MPYFTFKCPDAQRIPGCIERISIYAPFVGQGRHPQTGQAIPVPDAGAAWRWLMTLADRLPFPPGVTFELVDIQRNAPSILAIQTTAQPVERAQVDAIAITPQGHPGDLSPFPTAAPPGVKQRSDVEELPAGVTGLPGSEPVFGEQDGMGGTFTDTDSRGRETPRPRDLRIPQGPPVQQRQ